VPASAHFYPGHLAIIGQGGCGKSWRARVLVQPRPACIYVDITGDVEKARDPALAVGPVVESYAALLEYLQAHDDGRCHVTWWPSEEELPTALDDACALAWAYRDCIVVAEESAEWLDPRVGLPQEARRVLRRGRHRGVYLWTIGHRFADLPRLVTAQSTLLLYRIEEPTDLDYVRQRLGGEAREIVARLPDHYACARAPLSSGGATWIMGPDGAPCSLPDGAASADPAPDPGPDGSPGGDVVPVPESGGAGAVRGDGAGDEPTPEGEPVACPGSST
jgi:hypothetical protein